MSKYQPLTQRLARRTGDNWRVSFAELEDILGFPLPRAARTQGAWWTGAEKPHHGAWTGAGWRIEALDRQGETVVFRRESAAEPAVEEAPAETAAEPQAETPAPRPPLAAILAGAGAAVLAGAAALIASLLARRSAQQEPDQKGDEQGEAQGGVAP